jgi:hypothetical protein
MHRPDLSDPSWRTTPRRLRREVPVGGAGPASPDSLGDADEEIGVSPHGAIAGEKRVLDDHDGREGEPED